MGANIDAVETAKHYGIREDRAVDYLPDAKGTALNFNTVGRVVQKMACSMPIDDDWSAEIKKDYKARKGH